MSCYSCNEPTSEFLSTQSWLEASDVKEDEYRPNTDLQTGAYRPLVDLMSGHWSVRSRRKRGRRVGIG